MLVAIPAAVSAEESPDRIVRKPDGTVIVNPLPAPDGLRNDWPDDWRRGFRRRANVVIDNYREELGEGGGYHGFAMIVGEKQTHGGFDEFRKRVREQVRLKLDRLPEEGIVELHDGHSGRWMKMFYNEHNDRPGLTRNGSDVRWSEHYDLYRPLDGGEGPISLSWKEGDLHIEAGGRVFDARFTTDGQYEWKHAKE